MSEPTIDYNDVRENFKEIAINWQENLKRLFNEEFVRCIRRFKPFEFDHVGVAERSQIMRLHRSKVYHCPKLDVDSCIVDFENAHLNIEMSVERIFMDGEVYITNENGEETYEGLFKFEILKVTDFKIYVGLRKECDSFVPTTYYYELYFDADKIKVIADTARIIDRDQLKSFIADHIKTYLHSLIKRVIDKVVVDFSFDELFDFETDIITRYLNERQSDKFENILQSLQCERPLKYTIPFQFFLRHDNCLIMASAPEVLVDFSLVHRIDYDSLRIENNKPIYCSDGDICNIQCMFNVVCDRGNRHKAATFVVRPLYTKLFIAFEPNGIDNRNFGNTHVREITDIEVEEDWNDEPELWVREKLMPYMKTFLRSYANLVCSEFNKCYENK